MFQLRCSYRLVWSMSLLLAMTGCRSERRPVMPQTGIIPLKVWIVVGNGESGQVGNTSNRGCRLSSAEVDQYVSQLQQNQWVFGSNIIFQWTLGTATVIEDTALLPFGNRTRTSMAWHQTITPDYWQEDHLNVYFVGNVQPAGSPPDAVMALTLDPAGAESWTPDRARILINDGGFSFSSGFDPLFAPQLSISYNVLEHEVAHYLARFSNRSFGVAPNQRTYDFGEHDTSTLQNLLDVSIPPAFPLVVHGRWNQEATEQKEVWDRVYAGTWNNP